MKNIQKGGTTTTTILVVLLLLAVPFGYYFYSSNNMIRQQISKPSQAESQPKVPAQVPIQTSIKKIGDKFVLGDIQYKILSTKDLGSDLNKYTDYSNGVIGMGTTQGKFVEIKIHVENIGKNEVGVNKILLVDSDNRKFDFSINPSAMLSVTGYEMYGMYPDYEGIKAGFSENFIALFEVSEQSSGLQLDFPDYYGRTAFQIPLGL
jgi:hypothetical protein